MISDGFPPARGTHRYRWAVFPHAGDWRDGDVLRRAHEFQQPLLARTVAAPLPFPFERSFLRVPDGVVLSGLNMTGSRMRARLYDATGESRTIDSRWGFRWRAARAVRLDGRVEHGPALKGDVLRFALPAWKIVTLEGEAEGGLA